MAGSPAIGCRHVPLGDRFPLAAGRVNITACFTRVVAAMSRSVSSSASLRVEWDTAAGLLAIGRRLVPLGDRLCIEWDVMACSLVMCRSGVPLGEQLGLAARRTGQPWRAHLRLAAAMSRRVIGSASLRAEWDITAYSLAVRRHVVPLDDRLGLAVRCMGHHGVLTRNSSPLCSAGLSVPSRRRPSEHHGVLYPQVVAAMSPSVSSSASLRVERGIAAGLLAIGRRRVPLGDRLCVEWDTMAGLLAIDRRDVPLHDRPCVEWDITAY